MIYYSNFCVPKSLITPDVSNDCLLVFSYLSKCTWRDGYSWPYKNSILSIIGKPSMYYVDKAMSYLCEHEYVSYDSTYSKGVTRNRYKTFISDDYVCVPKDLFILKLSPLERAFVIRLYSLFKDVSDDLVASLPYSNKELIFLLGFSDASFSSLMNKFKSSGCITGDEGSYFLDLNILYSLDRKSEIPDAKYDELDERLRYLEGLK